MSLNELRQVLKEHPAFVEKTKLDVLAEKYGVKIVFNPKFHCELNAIEGMWCNQKHYVRTRSNQKFDRMILLVEESRENFSKNGVYKKLIRRFWRSIEAYKKGATYIEVPIKKNKLS